jgi:hypothetical protein
LRRNFLRPISFETIFRSVSLHCSMWQDCEASVASA